MKKGIDISKFQANLNLQTVKDAGMDFVIIRAGYTGWGNAKSKAKDKKFEEFYSQAKNLGIPVGAYYFTIARSYQDGVDEANWLYENCLKGKQFEYPIYIDVEDDTGGKQWLRKAGKEAVTQGIKGFCETLEAKGYYVGIYASDISGFKELMNVNDLSAYDKWVARYGSKPTYVTEYGMWQHTSSGRINGYNGNLDVNESYKDYPSIIKNGKMNGFGGKVVNPAPTPAPSTEIPAGFFPTRGYFKRGDVSPNVGKIALFMRKVFPKYTDEKALGNIYGPYIESAIKTFQKNAKAEGKYNSTVDGYCGPITVKSLMKYGFKI